MTRTLTVHVPLTLARHAARKHIVGPDGRAAAPTPSAPPDSALIKALARAHRWQRLLEAGEHATVRDLAAAERINPSYLSRILRLTLLSPTYVEAILAGIQPPTVNLETLQRPFPLDWSEQARTFCR